MGSSRPVNRPVDRRAPGRPPGQGKTHAPRRQAGPLRLLRGRRQAAQRVLRDEHQAQLGDGPEPRRAGRARHERRGAAAGPRQAPAHRHPGPDRRAQRQVAEAHRRHRGAQRQLVPHLRQQGAAHHHQPRGERQPARDVEGREVCHLRPQHEQCDGPAGT